MEVVSKYNETELVLLLQQRNKVAYTYLYDNYAGALRAVIFNIVNEEELSNDVLQDVFVKIWRQIESYDTAKGRLFTWMLNIARNASIDIVRSKGFRNNRQTGELTDETQRSAGSSELNVDTIGLKKIVYQLKEEYRVLIDLSYFQGYTQDEISKALSIPLGTVKTRLRTALVQLREIIKP